MRVIAGKARRIQLDTLPGLDTRPTTDRIKETLFNMLQPYLADCDFLDLFAGSGAIGIEALSRGAANAVFVENNSNAAKYIESNLKKTGLDSQAKLLKTDALTGIHAAESEGMVFDIIFMDPPYNKDLERQILETLSTSKILYADTLIVVEASLETSVDYANDLGFEIVKEKKYKTNKHFFLKRNH